MDELDDLMREYGVDDGAAFDIEDASFNDMGQNYYDPANGHNIQQNYQQPCYLNEDDDNIGSSEAYDYNLSSPSPSQRVPATLNYARQNTGSTQQLHSNVASLGYMNRRQAEISAYSQVQVQPVNNPQSTRGNNPRNAHGIRLHPVSELPDIYRGIFKFGVFNAMQSKCFDTIMRTKENLVVSAPTGGGKTVLFELSLISLLQEFGHASSHKCVYVAPTKALCGERTRDWTEKFEPLGVKCCEMTGDTIQMGKNAWKTAKDAKVIITTSEKWDSLTRSWHDHGEFLSEVKLFLVDEVHVLNESRGSTLEVVISRMKMRGIEIRLLLVSATVPNICDIANWVGNSTIGPTAPATVYEFGEDYRPCKIIRHVYGYPRKNQNDFSFSRSLDFKIYSIIQQHSCGKPILIFCSTRRGVLSTADQLLKDYEESTDKREATPWVPPRHLDRSFHDKRIEKLVKAGIGIHHAGLNLDDRREIERLFLDGSLRVVTATSTLAVGVNLPAHTVIIKGVKIFQNNTWQEYSDLDIVQMIGRAGRPQFDKEGVAIMMCEQELEHKYRNLVQGKTILESSLHQNLTEHLNSEIGLGTVTNIASAKDWIHNSFLRQRIQCNPNHYHIGKSVQQSWEARLDDLILLSVKKLKESELLEGEDDNETAELIITDYGDIMSKYYIRQATMDKIMKMPEHPTLRDILEVISSAEELGDVRLRGGDKQIYKKMNDHIEIRYKIKKVEKASDKVFVLIQAVLGGVPLSAPEYKSPDSQPTLDAVSIFRHTARIARAIVEVGIIKKSGAQLKHGLELMRCLTAKAWEDRPIVLRQVDSIGEKSIMTLAEKGINSLQKLRKQDASAIELLLGRRPPYGHTVLAFLQSLPQYQLSIDVDDISSYNGKKPVSVTLTISCSIADALVTATKTKQRTKYPGMTTILTTTSDMEFIDFRRIATKVLKESRTFTVTAELTKPSQSIRVHISSENHAGVGITSTYKPNISAIEYPIMDTHPRSSEEMLIEAVANDPSFWNNDLDDAEDTDVKYESQNERTEQKTTGSQGDLPSSGKSRASNNGLVKQLPNGNYACNHNCKDKSGCRHLCCKEGMPKPTQTSKRVLGNKNTNTMNAAQTNKKAREKNAEKANNDLVKLDMLHKRTGVTKSLRISDDRRIKLKPRAELGATLMDFDLADIKETKEEGESSQEMPDAKTFIQDLQSARAEEQREDSEYSEDSELNAIMLTMDAENLSGTPGNRSLGGSGGKDNIDKNGGDKQFKRKEMSPGGRSGVAKATGNIKRLKIVDEVGRPDGTTLFLQNQVSSEPSADLDFCDVPILSEDDFAPDSTLFDIVPSRSLDSTTEKTFLPKDLEAREGQPAVELSVQHLKKTSFSAESEHEVLGGIKEVTETGNEEWLDLIDWLENSASVEII